MSGPTVAPTTHSPAPIEADGLVNDPDDDNAMQEVLERSTPHLRSDARVQSAAEAAWTALRQDLTAGGWSQLHRQATVVAEATRPAPEPGEVTVTMIWSGTRAITGPTDRRRTHARATPTSAGNWQIQLLP